MSFLTVPTFNVRDFTLTHKSVLVGEASTIRFNGVARIFDDACDVGIAIESPTGRVERFVLSERHIDNEGDLMYWDFEPVNARLETVKSVRIYND